MNRSLWKVSVAVMIGFVLGALAFRTSPVRAQAGAIVSVELVPVLGLSSTLQAKGAQVVGFSCVSKDGKPECYVASTR
jgi:hypothetical protein